MIWLLKPDHPKATEFAPAMDGRYGDSAGFASGRGQAGACRFRRRAADLGCRDIAAGGGRAAASDRRAAGRLPRGPARRRTGCGTTLAEMIRYRALLIAAGYPDGNDCDALRSDPAFKMAVGRLPESGADLCSQPTISRLENLPGATALKRMMAAMVELFCDSFDQVPRRILLDIDDTEDRVHGGQQLSLFNAYYDSRCFLPIHIYEATTGKPVAVILRPGKTPDGAEVALVLRHVIGRIRARWPAVDIVVRGDSHYAPARGDGVVRAPARRLHLRPGRQHGAAAPGQPARRGCRSRAASTARRRKSAATAISAMPRKAGRSSAASSPASRPVRRGPTAASSSPTCRACPRRSTRRSIAPAARPKT